MTKHAQEIRIGADIIEVEFIDLSSASPETLYPNKKQQVARSYGDKEF